VALSFTKKKALSVQRVTNLSALLTCIAFLRARISYTSVKLIRDLEKERGEKMKQCPSVGWLSA
jgi:hypothetical protein